MIGLEVEDARAVAVRVDDRGAVQARAVIAAERGNLAAAAEQALSTVDDGSPGERPVGIAAPIPDAPALAALAARFGGRMAHQSIVASGTAAAVAEGWIGAARGVQDLVFFACGEHITGGVVHRGLPLSGHRGRAASLGWLALNPVEREDYRKTGCLEAEAASAGIVRRLVWRVKSGDRSRVADAVNDDLAAITVQHVLDAARQNDGVAISVIRDTAKYLGMAAANLVVVFDPEMLVVGGIIASAADLLMEPLRTEISRRLPKVIFESLRIESAALGEDAAAVGAARMVGAAIP
jgi:predicted NBD/HSP70 family sugar kinase